MARVESSSAQKKIADLATTHTASAAVTKDIERFDATSSAVTATLPTAVGITGRSFTIMKVDSSTNAVNVATTSSQTITGTGGTTDAIISQGAATTYTSNGANWVTTSTAGIPFADPGADKIVYFQNSTKAIKPVTIGSNLTFTSGTLAASGGSGLTVGTTAITSGAASRLLYENGSNLLGELILGTNLSISGGNTLDAAGGSATFHSFSVTMSANQTGIVSNTATKITWGTEEWDTNNNFASGTFTPTVAGKYMITASALVTGTTLATNQETDLLLYKNGVYYAAGIKENSGTGLEVWVSLHCLVDMNGSTDTIEMYIAVPTTSGTSTVAQNNATRFQGVRVG